MPKFKKLYEIQYCYICHAPLTHKNYTIDHEPPRGRGGVSVQLPCCDKCNHDKGMLTAEEYAIYKVLNTVRCGNKDKEYIRFIENLVAMVRQNKRSK